MSSIPLATRIEPWPCIHRGTDPVCLVNCPTCVGSVNVKVFACAVHGQCSIGRMGAEHVCRDCTERVRPEKPAVLPFRPVVTAEMMRRRNRAADVLAGADPLEAVE